MKKPRIVSSFASRESGLADNRLSMCLSYAEQETFEDMDMIENKAGLFQNLRKRWSGTWGGDVQLPEEEGGQVVPHGAREA